MGVYGCEAMQDSTWDGCCAGACCNCEQTGASRVVFRQFPRSHTQATRHCYCFFKCSSRQTEKIEGGILAEAGGLDPESALAVMKKVHDAQAAWLKKNNLSQPAGTAFEIFKAESCCSSLTVLDSADPNQNVLRGNILTKVTWQVNPHPSSVA